MRSRRGLTLRMLLMVVGLLLAVSVGSASAGAGENGVHHNFSAGDPLDTNIPYVAWAGEEVRLVKCIDGGIFTRLLLGSDAEWAIVDSSVRQRSGELRDPVFFDDTDRRTGAFEGQGEQRGRVCWAIDVDSVHAGMTRIKMAVDANEGVPGSPVIKHDFLVIWLGMNAPELEELGDDAFPGIDVGDPDGGSPADYFPIDGEFLNGLIRVTVTGSFVDLHGDARTLPSDWASLAGRYAIDDDDEDGRNPDAWDIHDDQTEREGHTTDSFCITEVSAANTIDAVDNCLGGPEFGPFSRTEGFGGDDPNDDGNEAGGTWATVGPFDPVRPGTSYLPDGKLDAGDAPMPAARIDLDLTGGVGALAEADKHEIYSRDREGSSDAHNLYAPFYVSLIPADSTLTNLIYTTSGTHGALSNNFPGYLVGPLPEFLGVYHYWDFVRSDDRGGTNDCNDVGGSGQFPPDGSGEIPLPTGIDEATLYTDEHGEALVWFLPEVGADLSPDNQNLCDLGEADGVPDLLGTATISAEGMDPYQPTFDDPRESNDLVKNVYELAGKSLDCYPKTPIEALCVETITDIRGNPVVGAPVLFTREPDGVLIGVGPPGIEIPGLIDFAGAGCLVDESGVQDGVICRTNADGQAGVLVKSTLNGVVDVIAENRATRRQANGILRDRCIRFFGSDTLLPQDFSNCADAQAATGSTLPPPNGGTGGTGGTGGGTGTSGGTSTVATVVSLNNNVTPAAKPEAKAPAVQQRAAVKSAKLRMVKGKLRLIVMVKGGAAKTAKVRIRLVYRTGRVVNVVRTVKVGKAAQVPNLVVSKHVKSVRVAVMAS